MSLRSEVEALVEKWRDAGCVPVNRVADVLAQYPGDASPAALREAYEKGWLNCWYNRLCDMTEDMALAMAKIAAAEYNPDAGKGEKVT